MKSLRFFPVVIAILFSGCADDELRGQFEILTYSYDFDASDFSWTSGFADFPTDADSSFYELAANYTDSPAGRNSLMISGNNHSDDLFMYWKKKITGLRPSTEYIVTWEIEFESQARRGEVGVGGAPGESVYLKVGATKNEPLPVVSGDQFRMNIDKGHQSEGGDDMVRIGDISVPAGTEGFVVATRSNSPNDMNSTYKNPISVTSNDQGELWLIVGTDSGFEGTTTLYYRKISAVFSRNP
jgi:hypothetical protein